MDDIYRKLTAIMFTDIFQYSRLMSKDENRAFSMLSEHDKIMAKIIPSFKGRILKRMGDAVFAEFESSVDALQCAVKIQEQLKEYNNDKCEDDKILVRIGLHEGDVIVKGDDLFGEGVNVAARLEPLADPGGICVSEALYQSVKTTTKIEALKFGDVELKNILQKYTIYKIPSPYENNLISKTKPLTHDKSKHEYQIKNVTYLPVKYLSPLEIAMFTLLFCGISIFILSYLTVGHLDINSILSFLSENKLSVSILTILLILTTFYFYSMISIRIVFDDVRNVDHLIDFLASQIGYSRQLEKNNTIIFKPSIYHFIMYSARKIKVIFDGNAIIINGNYMFIKKLLKVIRSFETVKSDIRK
ncbi:MAG: adenylate/guanylate cyclase domain-containing protein [Desulfobacterales bacterium]|nr:adenylate/guanylate cyclase domain-containing protein [Desulfobacterales bacterium]MBF0396671.1 adenylate/guanylate cyclase domain-containing protein [Desulfobacterales bacterium]